MFIISFKRELSAMVAMFTISPKACSAAVTFFPLYQLLEVKTCSAKTFRLSSCFCSAIKVLRAVGFWLMLK
jgi:hypothetical protein